LICLKQIAPCSARNVGATLGSCQKVLISKNSLGFAEFVTRARA